MGFTVNGEKIRVKQAAQAQNVFRHLVRRAQDIGMVGNSDKTVMVCVLDAQAFKAEAYMLDADQGRIGSQTGFKALGMHFSDKPDMSTQVMALSRRFPQRLWTLRNLKQSGFNTAEVLQVYKLMIRPIADYSAVAYHASLTDY